MRIVDRKTFMGLPSGTLYQKISVKSPSLDDITGIEMKGDSYHFDFLTHDLSNPCFEGWEGSDDNDLFFDEMLESGISKNIEYDCWGRDGFFEKEQLFAVWEKADFDGLMLLLKESEKAYEKSL